MSTQEHYDLVILGSGSTAFAAAIHAQELGKTAVMTEGRTLGGTCVNRGCLPSKNWSTMPPIRVILASRLGIWASIFLRSSPKRMRSSVRTVTSTTRASWTTQMRKVSLPLRSCQGMPRSSIRIPFS